jgi:hypothetical protein
MKSFILGLGILSLLSFTGIDNKKLEVQQTTFNSVECKYSQCKAIDKSTEKQCKHCVSNDGDSFCYQHD